MNRFPDMVYHSSFTFPLNVLKGGTQHLSMGKDSFSSGMKVYTWILSSSSIMNCCRFIPYPPRLTSMVSNTFPCGVVIAKMQPKTSTTVYDTRQSTFSVPFILNLA